MMIRDIKWQLLALIVINFLVGSIIGGLGYMKLKESDAGLHQVLDSNLIPITQIADFRRNDTMLNEYLLSALLDNDPTPTAPIGELQRNMTRAWRVYYASGVSSRAEVESADRIAALLPDYMKLVDQMVLLIENRRFEEAKVFLHQRIQPVRTSIKESSEKLYAANESQSQRISKELSSSIDASLVVFAGFAIACIGISLFIAILTFRTIWSYLSQIHRLANDISRNRLKGEQQVGDEIAQVDRLLALAREIR
ncbi:MCP four helix bundle domain-containing protein [Herbaspirillum sp.]|uniref:MCP four helix bundle domain-containing protein n=1 Tax=Herbaspirillum sp. TaxID=1890675 RepID=UPI001B1093DE|nr:MCP four helix bundle domain-containing protein [Herbaspirillum sp.]MBO9535207.1 MCP four helix bundle domain-containing protein [Herbaspirillum sp.]